MFRFALLALVAGASLVSGLAEAQNTGGVFGPVVNEGHRLAQYRIAFVPEDGAREERFAQRVHGEASLNDRLMARLVVQAIDRGGPDGQDFQFAQGELFWEASAEEADLWKYGFRFDARVANGATPDQVGVNWTNQFALGDRLTARAVALSVVQFGDRAGDGVLLSARGSLIYSLGGGYSLALQSYNSLGSTEDFGTADRAQQLGPTLNGRAAGGWGWSLGALFGLNDASPDQDFRFWFGRAF